VAEPYDLSAWIALFIGLYALAAAAGELRDGGGWAAMIGELEHSQALRFLTGVLCLFIGGAIYLASPWQPGDWLSVTISVIGGLAVAEGLLLLASGERFARFAARLIGKTGEVWAGIAALVGFALTITALLRLGTI
jgi:hypothetical protein